MRRMCTTKSTSQIAGLLFGLLFAIVAIPLGASAAETHPQHPVIIYDKAHEITFTGTIDETVSKAPAGSPAGLHLMVTNSDGTVDAHLGPYMSKETLEALHAGTPVQIIGAMEVAHGKSFLLAREVMVGGRTITVRNEKGFLVPQSVHVHAKVQNKNQGSFTGGAR
jgi:hypothetical protein